MPRFTTGCKDYVLTPLALRRYTKCTLNFSHPYLTEQIFAYIGNKRRLLPLIHRAITAAVGDSGDGMRFLDAFAGSGVVSRLARLMGFGVHANDWEEFSFITNAAYVATDRSQAEGLFAAEGSLEKVLRDLNEAADPPPEQEYIARHYAPASPDIRLADYRTERLFYTRQNALAIDRIRYGIDTRYPKECTDPDTVRKRHLLIAGLIYQAATHTNTSGVFKACHRGFGGHGGDALDRILAPISLIPPVLLDSPQPCVATQMDANELARDMPEIVDIAYLDPPYNQHQYGSNYHMLTTIARWDRPPVSSERSSDGRFLQKAGIRRDWVQTKSRYCSRAQAPAALSDLIGHLQARHILLSYSTDGRIPFDDLLAICSGKGRTAIVSNEYTRYPGGKKSNVGRPGNAELVLCVDTSQRCSTADLERIRGRMARQRLAATLGRRFREERLLDSFRDLGRGRIEIDLDTRGMVLQTRDHFTISPPDDLHELTRTEAVRLQEMLDGCVCATKEQEIQEILTRIDQGCADLPYYVSLLPQCLKHLAHRKYRSQFELWLQRMEGLQDSHPALYGLIDGKLQQIRDIARKRFG